MLTTLEYKVFIDKSLNKFNAKNVFDALEKVHDDYSNIIKLEDFNDKTMERFDNKNINKNYVLFTESEELLRKWQISGGKAFYLDNKKNACYPDVDKLIITNSPKEETENISSDRNEEVEEIYKFILKCLHIYK